MGSLTVLIPHHAWRVLGCREALEHHSWDGKAQSDTWEAGAGGGRGIPRPAPWGSQTLRHPGATGSLRRAKNGGGP